MDLHNSWKLAATVLATVEATIDSYRELSSPFRFSLSGRWAAGKREADVLMDVPLAVNHRFHRRKVDGGVQNPPGITQGYLCRSNYPFKARGAGRGRIEEKLKRRA